MSNITEPVGPTAGSDEGGRRRRLVCRLLDAACVVAFACLGLACQGGADRSPLPAASGQGVPPPTVPRLDALVSESEATRARDAYTGTGTLYAQKEAELGPKQTGVLAAISVNEGDRVKQGQLLFRLEAASASLQVAQAKAALAAAEVAKSSAAVELGRTEALHKRGSVAPALLDRAKSAHDQASAEVERAKVLVNLSRTVAGDLGVRSPIDGVVTKKFKNVGETVTLMPPTVVVIVQDLGHLELRAELPESALKLLGSDTELEMFVPALGITRRVPIKRVGSTVNPRTRTVEVIADVDNEDGTLKPGLLAQVTLGRAAKAGGDTAGPGTGAEPKQAPTGAASPKGAPTSEAPRAARKGSTASLGSEAPGNRAANAAR